MTHLSATYLAGKNHNETDWQHQKKLNSLAVSCFIIEVLDLYFCIQTDSSDAAQSTAIDYCWVKDVAIAVEMITNIGSLTENRFQLSVQHGNVFTEHFYCK